MSLELSNHVFIHAITECYWETGNLLGYIHRECETPHSLVGASPWIYVYRFRHFRDDKTFGSKDEKNWYRVDTPGEDLDAELETLKKTLDTLSAGGREIVGSGITVTELDCYGDEPKVLKFLTNNKNMNFKVVDLDNEEVTDLGDGGMCISSFPKQ